jgi:hypothetical protein
MKSWILLAALVLLPGCATIGKPVDVSLVDQLQQNIATPADAIKLLGQPTTTTVTSVGTTVMVWSYAHGTAFGSAESKAVYLTFGADGRLQSKTVSQAQM